MWLIFFTYEHIYISIFIYPRGTHKLTLAKMNVECSLPILDKSMQIPEGVKMHQVSFKHLPKKKKNEKSPLVV